MCGCCELGEPCATACERFVQYPALRCDCSLLASIEQSRLQECGREPGSILFDRFGNRTLSARCEIPILVERLCKRYLRFVKVALEFGRD